MTLTDSALVSSSNSQSTTSSEFAAVALSEVSAACTARLMTCAKHRTHWSFGSKLILSYFSTRLRIFIRTLLFDALSVVTAKICNLFQWRILDQCLQTTQDRTFVRIPKSRHDDSNTSSRFSPECGPKSSWKSINIEWSAHSESIQWAVIPKKESWFFDVHTSSVNEILPEVL